MASRLLPFLAASLFATSAAAQDLSLESRPSRWRITIERFEATRANNLSTAGVHFDLLDVAPDIAPGIYAGLGGYGALSGTSGGLFYGGATVGLLKEIYPGWNLDFGWMAGAGGGGSADTGSGLVMRPHIAIEKIFGPAALRLEVARLDFVNGNIEDTHFALGFSLPGEILEADQGDQPNHITPTALLWRRLRITPTVTMFSPDSGMRRTTGVIQKDEIHLAGVEFDYFVNDSLYVPLEVAGAGGGGVGGFAMVLTGVGGTWPVLVDELNLEGKVLVGSGGGGHVDTGGGFIWGASGGFSWGFEGLSLNLLGGLLSAPDGDFDGTTLSLGLAWNPYSAELAWDYRRSQLENQSVPGSVAELDSLRVQALHKSYFPNSSSKTNKGTPLNDNLHLAGVGIEKPFEALDEDWAATARMFAAWGGESGGYAEGLVGLQYELTPFSNARFHTVYLRGEIGAGGGGDVDTGSGLLYHLAAGWRFQYSRDLALSLDVGSVEADHGTFEGESATVGISYVLNRAVLRR